MAIRADERPVALQPGVQAGGATGAAGQFVAADLTGTYEVMRESDPGAECSGDHQRVRAAAKTTPDRDV